MRTFRFNDGTSDKFWNAWRDGVRVYTAFGKHGTKGQTRLKDCASETAAESELLKMIAKKLAEGYEETTPKAAPVAAAPASPLQRSLEDALAEDPDDLAAHSAYADYLMEQGDPRGEFIQTQLALEDERRSSKERTRLRQREADLLALHARTWLGDAGRFLVGDWSGEGMPWQYRFAHGWLDFARLLPFPGAVIAAVARSPESRLLRRLEILYDMRYHPFDFDEFVRGPNAAITEGEAKADVEFEPWEPVEIMPALLASPHLSNLRAFKLGFSDDEDRLRHSTMVQPFGSCTAEQLTELLQKCPRLEELYLNAHVGGLERFFGQAALGNLRVLQYYFGSEDYYTATAAVRPIMALAGNASLRQLTTLRLHAGRETTLSVEELDAILRSRNLPALTHLKFGLTYFGDDGCRRVVDSGILRRLKVLDLGYGNMTDAGARLLAGSGDLRYLDVLNVSRNALTSVGVAALTATGVRVVADEQHDAGDDSYRWEVDVE